MEGAIGEALRLATEAVARKLREGKKLSTEDIFLVYLATIADRLERIDQNFAELHNRVDAVNKRVDDIQAGIGQLRGDMYAKFDELRREVYAKFDELRKEMGEKYGALEERFRSLEEKYVELREEHDEKYSALQKEVSGLKADMYVKFDELKKEFYAEMEAETGQIREEVRQGIAAINTRIDQIYQLLVEILKVRAGG